MSRSIFTGFIKINLLLMLIIALSNCSISKIKEVGFNGRGCIYTCYTKIKNRDLSNQEIIALVEKYNAKKGTQYKYFNHSWHPFTNYLNIRVWDEKQAHLFYFDSGYNQKDVKLYKELFGVANIDPIVKRTLAITAKTTKESIEGNSANVRDRIVAEISLLLIEIAEVYHTNLSEKTQSELFYQVFNNSITIGKPNTSMIMPYVRAYSKINPEYARTVLLKGINGLSVADLVSVCKTTDLCEESKKVILKNIAAFEYKDPVPSFEQIGQTLITDLPTMALQKPVAELKFITGKTPSGLYLGEIIAGQPHGFGAWLSSDHQFFYVGRWEHGKFHGRGSFRRSGQANAIDNYNMTGNFATGAPSDNAMVVISSRLEREDFDIQEKIIYTLSGGRREYRFAMQNWDVVEKNIMGRLQQFHNENQETARIESEKRVLEKKLEENYENMDRPAIKSASEWRQLLTPHEDEAERYIVFEDDTSGYIHSQNGRYFIKINSLFGDRFYKDYESTLKALYIYEKHGIEINKNKN